MDYVQPQKLVEETVKFGQKKASTDIWHMLVKGFLSGVFLGYATSFAFRISEGFTGGAASLVSAAVFPVGFAMIVLLGLELVTGNFAIVPMALLDGKASRKALLRNWCWVFMGNLLGCVFYGFLLAIALTEAFQLPAGPLADKIIAVAQSKTHTYEHVGLLGWLTAFTKAILCNWMVALGSILGLVSSSAIGKIVAIWLPVMTFFALGYEHSVVNMFVIPTAMMLGADISAYQWWFWNQIPVTLGNVVGGGIFTGVLLYYIHGAHGKHTTKG